jgi:hypothetical protein
MRNVLTGCKTLLNFFQERSFFQSLVDIYICKLVSVFENIDVAPCQVFVLHNGLSLHQLSFLELLNLLLTTKILNYLKELLTQNQVFSFDLKILFFHIQATELSKS